MNKQYVVSLSTSSVGYIARAKVPNMGVYCWTSLGGRTVSTWPEYPGTIQPLAWLWGADLAG